MSLPLALVRGLLETAVLFGLIAVGIGLFLAMPETALRNDYLKALVPAVLVVLAAGWARVRHPDVRPG